MDKEKEKTVDRSAEIMNHIHVFIKRDMVKPNLSAQFIVTNASNIR